MPRRIRSSQVTALTFVLPDRVKKPGLVRRFTAPGSDIKDLEQKAITFAGCSTGKDGLITSGEEVTEVWISGEVVLVGNVEAVLITF